MGDYTRADASRLNRKLEARKYQRRVGEMIFLCVLFTVVAFTAGYVLGKKNLFGDSTVPEFAEKLGKARRDRNPPTPEPKTHK